MSKQKKSKKSLLVNCVDNKKEEGKDLCGKNASTFLVEERN
jgi:hypothetical protein